MKIGFLAYSLLVLQGYWEQLKYEADCWWGVTQRDTAEELEDRNIGNVVFCPDELQYLSEREGNKYVSVNPGKAEMEVVEKIAPDLWITDQTNRLTYALKKAPWVQTFHSLCFKKHTFHPLTLQYDLLLLPGEYHKQEFITRLDFEEGDERLKIVGWPRVDDLLQGKYNREEILNSLGLDPSRKTVMYAPTWGGYAKDMSTWGQYLFARWFGRDEEVFGLLCAEAKRMKLNVIVKIHHLSIWSSSEKLKAIAEKYDALWVTPGMSNFQIDPNPYLWVTDVLISDMSGIIMDYMVLDRPIIFVDPDETVDAWREYSIPANFRAGETVQTPEQLVMAIEDSIEYPDRHREARQRVTSEIFCSLDGNASARAARAILDFAKARGIS